MARTQPNWAWPKARLPSRWSSRVSVVGVVREEDPKTARGERTLPLDQTMVTALKVLKAIQESEKKAAGPGYGKTDIVVVDELGVPYNPGAVQQDLHATDEAGGSSGDPAARHPSHLRNPDTPTRSTDRGGVRVAWSRKR